MNRILKKVVIVKYIYLNKGFRRTRQYLAHGLLFLITLSVMSCATYTPASRDAEVLPVPEAFTLYETTAPAPEQWWEAFGSDELNAMMEKALGDNLSLRQVYARLEQSRYLMQQANAALAPSVNLGADASMINRHKEATGTSTTKDYGFGVFSSYEIDLWGRIQAQYRAAVAEAETSREDLYAAMLSLSGAVARQWVSIAALEAELEMVQGQLDLNKTNLEFTPVQNNFF